MSAMRRKPVQRILVTRNVGDPAEAAIALIQITDFKDHLMYSPGA
jgi:hypothetical protein